ncbi:hypothetical protein V5P93_004328 [Actinokineospora auranticolor]|uniref:Guanylate cyclase domain-containing protein n=1 Tax=Actinokineospora auranticolor TaxID=155976 RepID=A0A2S6GTM9_9PSEU|nr:hypothetical protein [Actinokineospora auranticolor]PPK68564.1 hypothetical protein CLV40_105293 [Actinokineospora auranticolor]
MVVRQWTGRGGPKHRSIVVVDMVGSSRWDNLGQVRARRALDLLVRAAFRDAGIPWWRLRVEGTGDGMIILVPPGISKVDLLDPVVPRLAAGLREYNSVVAARLRIRVRMAVHAGEVLRSEVGWVSTEVVKACRLVNGEPLYVELDRSPEADLVVVVSEEIHESVVRHGYRGIDPGAYVPVRIVVKEADLHARLLVAH